MVRTDTQDRGGFVDLGSLGAGAAAAGRFELRLDLVGGGVVLTLVRR